MVVIKTDDESRSPPARHKQIKLGLLASFGEAAQAASSGTSGGVDPALLRAMVALADVAGKPNGPEAYIADYARKYMCVFMVFLCSLVCVCVRGRVHDGERRKRRKQVSLARHIHTHPLLTLDQTSYSSAGRSRSASRL